jgi:hypothetical protein
MPRHLEKKKRQSGPDPRLAASTLYFLNLGVIIHKLPLHHTRILFSYSV